ncbi:MAG: hypothetical protein AAF992_11050 [Bacteroidota bacterium]
MNIFEQNYRSQDVRFLLYFLQQAYEIYGQIPESKMEIIKNKVTGDSMRVYRSSLDGDENDFELEVTLHPHSQWSKFPHFHLGATETFKVVLGQLSMMVGDKEIVLTPNSEEVIVGRNEVHCFWNNTDEYVTFRSVISPGTVIEKGIRATYALANAGRMNKLNMPRNLFELAILGETLDSYSPKLPWRLQKALIHLLAATGTLLGYRKRFERLVEQNSTNRKLKFDLKQLEK